MVHVCLNKKPTRLSLSQVQIVTVLKFGENMKIGDTVMDRTRQVTDNLKPIGDSVIDRTRQVGENLNPLQLIGNENLPSINNPLQQFLKKAE